jgi:hypothetical protein
MAAEKDSSSKSTNRTTDSQSSATTVSPQAGVTASGPLLHQLQRSIGNRATMQLFSQSRKQASPIQMKAAQLDAFMGAHMREYSKAGDVYTVNESKPTGDKIQNKQPIEDLGESDSTGKWGKIRVGATDGFIRKEKIAVRRDLSTAATNIRDSGIGVAKAFEEEGTAKDNIADTTDIISKGPTGKSEVLKDASGSLKDEIKKIEKSKGKDAAEADPLNEKKGKIDEEEAKFGVASSVFDTIGGIAGLVGLVKTFKEADSGSKKAAAATETVEAVQKTFSGVANMVDYSAKVSGKEDGVGDSSAVAGYAGSVGDGIAAIKSAFFAVKKIFELFRENAGEKGLTDGEKFRGGMEVLNQGLQSAQSAVKTVKSILEVLELGTGNLAKVVPGIGIAISAVKITIQVYDMIQSNVSRMQMTDIKRDFKEKYKANTKVVVDKSSNWFGAKSGTDKKELAKRKAELEAKPVPTPLEKEELSDIKEYELALEMKYINQKRLTRAGISLGLEMLSMAGDIATLSGAGAAAGVSMKAIAGGAKVGMSVARRVKQYGRDKAAQAPADSAWRSVFNADKSSQNKHDKRNKDVDVIFSMVRNLPEYTDDEAVQKQYQRVEIFIQASGCSTKELYKLNGDVEKQRELLMESMKKRE